MEQDENDTIKDPDFNANDFKTKQEQIDEIQDQNQLLYELKEILSIYTKNFQNFVKKIGPQAYNPVTVAEIKQILNLKFSQFPKLNQIQEIYKKNVQKQIQNKQIKRNWNEDDLQILVFTMFKYSNFNNLGFSQFVENNWEDIGKIIPGKTMELCKYKWLSLQKLSIQQVPWTKEEDQLLLQLVKEKGKSNWSEIAKVLYETSQVRVFRQSKKCRERYNNHLDPDIIKGQWSKKEDKQLVKLVQQYGKKWADIAKLVSGRTENAVKNRYNALMRKQDIDQELFKDNINMESLQFSPKTPMSMVSQDSTSSARIRSLTTRLREVVRMKSDVDQSEDFIYEQDDLNEEEEDEIEQRPKKKTQLDSPQSNQQQQQQQQNNLFDQSEDIFLSESDHNNQNNQNQQSQALPNVKDPQSEEYIYNGGNSSLLQNLVNEQLNQKKIIKKSPKVNQAQLLSSIKQKLGMDNGQNKVLETKQDQQGLVQSQHDGVQINIDQQNIDPLFNTSSPLYSPANLFYKQEYENEDLLQIDGTNLLLQQQISNNIQIPTQIQENNPQNLKQEEQVLQVSNYIPQYSSSPPLFPNQQYIQQPQSFSIHQPIKNALIQSQDMIPQYEIQNQVGYQLSPTIQPHQYYYMQTIHPPIENPVYQQQGQSQQYVRIDDCNVKQPNFQLNGIIAKKIGGFSDQNNQGLQDIQKPQDLQQIKSLEAISNEAK